MPAEGPSGWIAEQVLARPWVESLGIRPFFQPIVDLSTGQPLGYEVLSRGAPPFESPEAMFCHAKEAGMLWDLERACRTVAIQRISQLPPRLRGARFFLNVSPQILSDARFVEGFTRGMLRERGLDQENIVIEITEKDSIHDYGRFEELIHHYVDQGFRIALDDFGSGHSSLVTLIRCVPHFPRKMRLGVCFVRFATRYMPTTAGGLFSLATTPRLILAFSTRQSSVRT